MKNYFHILGIDPGASEDQIRKAFRRKAKLLHPDVNKDDNAKQAFVELQQAYAFLMNKAQRRNYESLVSEQKMTRKEQEHRENIYKLWVEHQQRKARSREAMEEYLYNEPASPFNRRFWKGINLVYNIFFLLLFLCILVFPIYNLISEFDKPEHLRRPIVFFIVPSIVGGVFVVYGYYYWFIMKSDHD